MESLEFIDEAKAKHVNPVSFLHELYFFIITKKPHCSL